MKHPLPAIAFILTTAATAAAQSPVILPTDEITPPEFKLEWGVRLSMDVTVPSDGFGEYEHGAGVTGGVALAVPVYKGLYVEPGVLLFYNTMGVGNYVIDDLPYDGSVRNFGVRIPLNLGYRFNINDNISLSLTTGPWFNFNISARQYANPNFEGPMPKTSKNLFDYGWHRFDAQWGFGVQATFSGRYIVGISGGVGTKALAARTADGHKMRMHRNTFTVTLGYNF